ncbi:Hypothetical predicted protein, partial [Paramuricea clavata]
MDLATSNIKTLARRSWLRGITLDYTSKRVYWIEKGRDIYSSDYDFQHEKKITTGSFSDYMLAIFGDSLYFQKRDPFSINRMNVSNRNTVHRILVDRAYEDLIVFHSSLQPM